MINNTRKAVVPAVARRVFLGSKFNGPRPDPHARTGCKIRTHRENGSRQRALVKRPTVISPSFYLLHRVFSHPNLYYYFLFFFLSPSHQTTSFVKYSALFFFFFSGWKFPNTTYLMRACCKRISFFFSLVSIAHQKLKKRRRTYFAPTVVGEKMARYIGYIEEFNLYPFATVNRVFRNFYDFRHNLHFKRLNISQLLRKLHKKNHTIVYN